MEGLKIYINKVKPQKQSELLGLFIFILLLIILLLLSPIILLLILFGGLYNLVFPSAKKDEPPVWIGIVSSKNISIEYKWMEPDDVPENLLEFYEEREILIFKTNPKTDFFEGYFSDFIVERDDGVFVQKIMLDNEHRSIQSAPLIFFKFENGEIEEIIDLKDFSFDSKGNPDDFIVSVCGKKGNFEVRLTK